VWSEQATTLATAQQSVVKTSFFGKRRTGFVGSDMVTGYQRCWKHGAGQACGGGGAPNVCGSGPCQPACAGKACGASDGRGNLCTRLQYPNSALLPVVDAALSR
jgi:hypothetical protein